MNWAHMRAPMIDWLQNNGAAISFIIIGFIFLWTTGLITYMLVSPRGLDEVSLTEMDLEYSKIAHRIDPWLKVGAFVALPISFDIILDAYRFFAKKDEYTSVTELVARTVLMLSYFVPNVLVLALLQGNRKESAVSILVTIFPLLYGLRIGSNLSIAFGHKLFSSADGREIELYTEARCALILAGIFASYITASAQLKVLGFLCVAFVIILLLDTVVRNLYLHIREMVNGQFKNHHNLIDVLYLAACALSIIAWVVVFAIFVIRTGVMPIHSPTADFIESRLLIAIGNSLVISVIPGIAWRISSDEKHEKLQARLNLIRYVSHEMRSPLNTAFLGLKLVIDELNSVDENLSLVVQQGRTQSGEEREADQADQAYLRPHQAPFPTPSAPAAAAAPFGSATAGTGASAGSSDEGFSTAGAQASGNNTAEQEHTTTADSATAALDGVSPIMPARESVDCSGIENRRRTMDFPSSSPSSTHILHHRRSTVGGGLSSGAGGGGEMIRLDLTADLAAHAATLPAKGGGQQQLQQQRRIRRRSVLNVTPDRHESFISIHRASLSASVSAPDSSSSHTSPRSSHASYASYASAAVGAVLASTVPTALSPNLAADSTMGAAGRTVGSSNTGEDMPRKGASMASGLYRIDSVFKFSSSSNSSSAPSSSCSFSALPSAAAGVAEVIGGGSPPSKVLAVDGEMNAVTVSLSGSASASASASFSAEASESMSLYGGGDDGGGAGVRGGCESVCSGAAALLATAPAPAAAPAALAGGQEEREDRGAEMARRAELLRVVGSIVTTEQCAELLETADLVRSSCQVALETLNDLLTYDKMDEKKLEVELEEINPWQLVNDTAKPFRINAEKQNVNLIVSCTDLLLEENWARDFVILADRFKFSQVVRNLVSNALKFTPARGTVKVQVEKLLNYPGSGVKRLRRNRLATPAAAGSNTSSENRNRNMEHARNAGRYVAEQSGREGGGEYLLRINVIDTGRGISAENQRKLFGQYVQFKAGEHQQGNGSGLGLWIAKNIVQLHGGTIRALSEGEGCGTTFRIELPLYPVDERRRHRRRRHSQSHSQSQIQSQRNAHTQEQPYALSGRAALLDELDASLESGTSSNNNISHVSHISHASHSTQSTGAELVVAPHSMEVTQHQQQHDSEAPSPSKGGPMSGIVRTFTPPSTRSLATFQREAERIAAVADASGAAGGESQESVGSVAVAGADAEQEVVAMCSTNPQSVGVSKTAEPRSKIFKTSNDFAGSDLVVSLGKFFNNIVEFTLNTSIGTLESNASDKDSAPSVGLRLRTESSDEDLYHSLPNHESSAQELSGVHRSMLSFNSNTINNNNIDNNNKNRKDGQNILPRAHDDEIPNAGQRLFVFLSALIFQKSSPGKYVEIQQSKSNKSQETGYFRPTTRAVAGYDLERGEASEGVFTQGTTGFELSHEASDGSALSVWDSEGSVKVETSSRVKRNAAGRCMTQRMMMQGKIFPSAVGVDDVSVPDRDDTSIAHIHHGDARSAAVVTPQRSLSLSHQHPSRKSITSCWATGPLRVLLVDDVALSRRMCRKILTRFGHSIFEASDGIEAVELIQRCIADLHASENRANVDQDDEDNGNNDCNVRNNTGDAEAPLIIKNGEALSPLPTSYLSRMNSRRSSDATVVQRGSGMFFSRISGPRRDSTGSNASITARISAPASERAAIRSGRSGSKSRSSSLARRDCGHIDAMDLGDCAGEYEEGGGIEETEGGEGDYLSLETSRENGISEEASMGWIDLVLMDDSMPRMSGTEATRALRELGYDGLICGLSGDIHADKVQLFLDCGADFVLGKPLSVTELENLVTAALVPASAALVQHQDHEQQQQHLHRQRRGETE